MRLAGKVAGFDLAQMGFTPKRIGGSFLLDASASATRPGCYAARIGLDSIEIRNGSRTDRIRATSVSFASDTVSTRAGVSSGDLSLQFSSRSPLDSLIAALTRSADTLARQIRLQNVDMEQLQPVLPDFDLQATAGRNNILNNLLKSRKASFKALEIRGGNHGPQPSRSECASKVSPRAASCSTPCSSASRSRENDWPTASVRQTPPATSTMWRKPPSTAVSRATRSR